MISIKDILDDHLYNSSLWLMVNSVVVTGLGFFFWTINARLFTPDQVGLATALISAMELIVHFSLLGFNVALVRYLPKAKKKDNMINSCFTLSALAALIIGVVFILGLKIFSPKLIFLKENPLFGILFIVFLAFNAIFILIESVFVVLRKTRFVFIKNFIFGLLKLVLPLILVFLGAFGIYSSWAIASVVALIVSSFFIPMKFRPKVDTAIIRRMFKFSSGNYIAIFLGTTPTYILPLMITNLLNAETAAYFYVPFMIAMLLYIIPTAVFAPFIAESSRSKTALKKNTKKAFLLVFSLLTLGVIVMLIVGKYLLLLFGPGYSENGTRLLQILALSSLPIALNALYIAIKNVQHKIKTVILVNLFTSVSVLISIYFLLDYGLIGIGIGWLVGKSIIAIAILLKIIKSGI